MKDDEGLWRKKHVLNSSKNGLRLKKNQREIIMKAVPSFSVLGGGCYRDRLNMRFIVFPGSLSRSGGVGVSFLV